MSGGARSPAAWVVYAASRAWLMEIRGYQAIWRLLARRPRVAPSARPFPYHQQILPVLLVFVVVSAIEVAVVDLLVQRWPAIRLMLLLLGLWGLIWMLGLLAGMLTGPHSVGTDGIRVRYGAETDIHLPWEQIASVERRLQERPAKARAIVLDDAGRRVLRLWVSDRTNLLIELEKPTRIRLPQGTKVLSGVAIYVEDPGEFLAEVRRRAGEPEIAAAES